MTDTRPGARISDGDNCMTCVTPPYWLNGQKFSQIVSGGNIVSSTDRLLAVRNGNQDVLVNPPNIYVGAVTPVFIFPAVAIATSGINIYTLYTAGLSQTFYLPVFPAINQIVCVVDGGVTASAAPITINSNGNNINANGIISLSYEIGSSGSSITLAWDTVQWNQIA